MIALAFRAAALTGAGALLILPDTPEHLALWGVLASSVAGLIKQVIDKRAERQERLDVHRFAMEDREFTRRARADIRSDIAHNTAITTDARDKADAAYEVANHVNEKIRAIAETALAVDRATALRDAQASHADAAAIRDAIAKLDGPGPPTWPSR
jgi:polygalacturonase